MEVMRFPQRISEDIHKFLSIYRKFYIRMDIFMDIHNSYVVYKRYIRMDIYTFLSHL